MNRISKVSEIDSQQNDKSKESRAKNGARSAGRAVLRLTSLGLLVGGGLVGVSGAKDVYDAGKIETNPIVLDADTERVAQATDEKQDKQRTGAAKLALAASFSGAATVGFGIANGGRRQEEGIVGNDNRVNTLPYDGPPNTFIGEPPVGVVENSVEVPLTPNSSNDPDAIFRRPL